MTRQKKASCVSSSLFLRLKDVNTVRGGPYWSNSIKAVLSRMPTLYKEPEHLIDRSSPWQKATRAPALLSRLSEGLCRTTTKAFAAQSTDCQRILSHCLHMEDRTGGGVMHIELLFPTNVCIYCDTRRCSRSTHLRASDNRRNQSF